MKKTKKIKDGYGNKHFISEDQYNAIRFIDNGGRPNKKLNKKQYKFIVKEYKRQIIILTLWYIKKSKKLRTIISKKLRINNSIQNISAKINKMGWKKIEKIYNICLQYSKKNKTRKIFR